MREASVARRRRLLAYVDWVRRRAATSTLSFAGPAVEGVALKSAEAPVVEGHERARLLLGDADQESPRATTPRSRVMQMLRGSGVHKQLLHAIDATPPRWRGTQAAAQTTAGRRRRRRLARRGLGRLVASTIAPPVAPEVKKPPEDDSDLECGICLSLLTDPVHTPCLHVVLPDVRSEGAEPGHEPPMSHLSRGRARGLDKRPVEARCSSASTGSAATRPRRSRSTRGSACGPSGPNARRLSRSCVDLRRTAQQRRSSCRWGAERSVRRAAAGVGRGDFVPSGVRRPGSGGWRGFCSLLTYLLMSC